MRAIVIFLLVAAATASGQVLTDPTGDVYIDHCQTAQTPISGFETMDLTELQIIEDPSHIQFTVLAEGITEEAGPDSGNYFIHLMRGQEHYTIRMFQDNAGTAAIAHVIATEGVSLFGPVIAQLPANAETGQISTSIPRDVLIDENGSPPIKGQTLNQILVSAEAHATGLYFCDFDGKNGGPAIIQDHMPEGWIDDAATFDIQFGGVRSDGPVELLVDQPFRASNGEATTYVYEFEVKNLGTDAQTFDFELDLPPEWKFHVPNGSLVVDAGSRAVFDAYLQVPFFHEHGKTTLATIKLASSEAWAEVDLGVHYLTMPQPAGHHSTVHLHSIVPVGQFSEIKSAMGGGDNQMFWNTQEDDDSDHDVPVGSEPHDAGHTWTGCLSPGLAIGMAPVLNATGSYEFEFNSDVPFEGTISGRISVVEPDERGPMCSNIGQWSSIELLVLEETAIAVDGPTKVEGIISAPTGAEVPFEPGRDLLLEIFMTTDTEIFVQGWIDLLPGATMTLPLADYHQPVPEIKFEEGTTAGFVDESEAASEDSPGIGLLALVAVIGLAIARRK